MSVVITANDFRTRLGAVMLDCMLTEEIDYQSQVTLYPVEDGGPDISDHITQGNKRLRISGLIATADVSNGFGFSSLFGSFADNSIKLIDVVEAVEMMYEARAVLDVYSKQLEYKDMAFTNLTISRSADGNGGNWASIKAELIKIRKVKLKTADVPAPETTAEPAKGRSGPTGKPAGKSNATSSTASGGGSGSTSNAAPTAEKGNSLAKILAKPLLGQ